MPGLFGLIRIGPDAAVDPETASALLAEMAQRMCHTGTEIIESWTDLARGFAIGRIGQPHLHRVAWPQRSVNGGATATFLDGVLHGEAAELREKLDDFECRGRAALPWLRGSFTAARWEPDRRRLTLAVDRRASRPMVFTVLRDTLYFAPEPKALLAVPGIDKTLDEAAIGVFLGAGYLLGHQTLFASMRRLSGGEVLLAEPGRRRVETYWRYRLSERGDGTPPGDLEAEMRDLVQAAVDRDVPDADRTVVLLDGGAASRGIAGAAEHVFRSEDRPLRTAPWSPSAIPDAGWSEAFSRAAYLLDGLSDVAARRPHQRGALRDLADLGVTCALAPDACLGGPRVASIEEALLSVGLRRLRPLRRVSRAVRPRVFDRWCDAVDAVLDTAARPLRGEHPDNARDLFDFRHRLQGREGPAAYLAQAVLDVRAPLLDESLLDFHGRIPAILRGEGGIQDRVLRHLAQPLEGLAPGARPEIDAWEEMLASPSPLRAHVEMELADHRSGLWELLDPDSLERMLPPIEPAGTRSFAAALRGSVLRIARAARRAAPQLSRSLANEMERGSIPLEQLFARVMVLKSWFDLFVEGNGGKRALERTITAGAALEERGLAA